MAKRVTPWNPNTADWLVGQRGSRTQDAVIADLNARGVKIGRAWLSRIENGEPFGAELLAAFVAYYKSVPSPVEETIESVSDPSLAAALTELAAELRASREGREATEARLRAVEAELESLRAPRADEGSPERSVPRETGR